VTASQVKEGTFHPVQKYCTLPSKIYSPFFLNCSEVQGLVFPSLSSPGMKFLSFISRLPWSEQIDEEYHYYQSFSLYRCRQG
jgi:hypothetical protein